MTAMRQTCTEANCMMNTRTDPVILDGCLPRGASFADGDAIAEINGHFMFIEFKPPGYEFVQYGGQLRLLVELSKLSQFTVLVVGADGPIVKDCRYILDGTVYPRHQCDTEKLRQIVQAWGEASDRNPRRTKGYVDVRAL